MLTEQKAEESLEHLQKEWEEAETFSSEDMAFFNGDIEESPSGWKRLAGVFTAEEVEQRKEPGKEYLSRYCGENMQDREVFHLFWRDETEAALQKKKFEKKLKDFDEEWKNAPPAEEGEACPEECQEEIRQIEEAEQKANKS